MIKIHDKLWYVTKPEHEENLAYMCQYAEDKEGNPLSNVVKMQATGRSWARISSQVVWKKAEKGGYVKNEHGQLTTDHIIPAKDGEEFIVDNTPTSGFYVGCSVSRWSTSNKLFRVKDPRGFTVEIPTDNLATLLHHTTVVKGVVQEECVWGREGNNHILLPVNSEPYLITLDQMDTLENKLISVKDLKVGDWVKFFNDNKEYYYVGRVKITWNVRAYTYKTSWSSHSYGSRDYVYGEWQEIQDDKWIDLFISKYTYSETKDWSASQVAKPKIVEIIKNEVMEIDCNKISIYCPARVSNKVQSDYSTESKILRMEVK